MTVTEHLLEAKEWALALAMSWELKEKLTKEASFELSVAVTDPEVRDKIIQELKELGYSEAFGLDLYVPNLVSAQS